MIHSRGQRLKHAVTCKKLGARWQPAAEPCFHNVICKDLGQVLTNLTSLWSFTDQSCHTMNCTGHGAAMHSTLGEPGWGPARSCTLMA